LSRSTQGPKNLEAILRWSFIASILVITAVGLVLGPSIGPFDESGIGDSFAAIAFLVALVTFVMMRAVILPSMASNPAMPLQNLAIVGYAFAESPAILGLVAALLSGRGWVALAFGLVALLAIASAAQYTMHVEQQRADLDFPRL
jgi:hypothetical protein